VVYGGGGIMPDVFVPIDTSFTSKYYTDILRKGLMNDFVISYMDKNRADLKNLYPELPAFRSSFMVDDKFFKEFTDFAAAKEVPADAEGIEKSGNEIKIVLKGLIARNLFDVSAYFEVISPIDHELMRAVEVMNEDNLFRKLSIAM